jgi:uncharacterized protein YcbK (DUF882 family)
MNEPLKNLTINETNMIASRRNFLARMAYGSLLAMGGSSIAEAAKHTAHGSAPAHKKVDVKSSHNTGNTHSQVKNAIHERLALKSEHNTRHNAKVVDKHHHHELALNEHNSRIHSSLVKDNHGGHHLQHQERERLLASQEQPSQRYFQHRNMPEFAMQDDIEESNYSGRIALPNRANNRFGRNGNITHKTLALQNMTTGDALNVTYFEHGRYLPDALHEINYLYRDHLTDEVHPVDTALLDQLHDLQDTLGVKKQIHVICGYRSPFTNAQLRSRSHGVAKNSLHMQGRAIDIRMVGVDSRTVRDAALSMAQGGVGYYPGSNFVHLDTGDVRTW